MTYQARVVCKNCGEMNVFPVENNLLVKDHLRLRAEKCSNCNFRM